MKKAVSLIVIALFAVHAVGFYAYFFMRLSEIHSDSRQQLSSLPDDQLELITVPRKDFREEWMREMEMEWGNKMYDIARINMDGPNVHIYALHDAQEDALLSLMDTILRTSQQDCQPVPAPLVQFLALIFIVPENTFSLLTAVPQRPELFRGALYSTLCSPVASPPPRS